MRAWSQGIDGLRQASFCSAKWRRASMLKDWLGIRMRSGALIRQRRLSVTLLAWPLGVGRPSGAGRCLRSAGRIITARRPEPGRRSSRSCIEHYDDQRLTSISYDAARTDLQVTDADPNIRRESCWFTTNRASIAEADGRIDSGLGQRRYWNREHTWPQAVAWTTSAPDDSDMHHVLPSMNDENNHARELEFRWRIWRAMVRLVNRRRTRLGIRAMRTRA